MELCIHVQYRYALMSCTKKHSHLPLSYSLYYIETRVPLAMKFSKLAKMFLDTVSVYKNVRTAEQMLMEFDAGKFSEMASIFVNLFKIRKS